MELTVTASHTAFLIDHDERISCLSGACFRRGENRRTRTTRPERFPQGACAEVKVWRRSTFQVSS